MLLKDVPFKWSRECGETMRLVSGSLIDIWLCHYDSEKVFRLATDASPVGVGAVLSHVIDGRKFRLQSVLELYPAVRLKKPSLLYLV